ncbi:MAG: cell division protein FtsZ [bacterium]
MVFEFIPETNHSGKIKVIGIGGAGCNAVDAMLDAGLRNVEMVIMNTDAQSLQKAKTEQKIQIGETITNGLGTGGNPDLGKKAAEESIDLIRDALLGANLVFLTAGLGGGTGTGALPVVAKLAKELGILTVGVITKPFKFEINRVTIAEQGIADLKPIIDALMVIPNDHLISMVGEKASLAETFATANQLLYQAVSSISDLINVPGIINVDFASIRSVMGNQGGAVIGVGVASGENRATMAVKHASESGLLETAKVAGAKNILLNITGGKDMTIGEIYQAAGTVAALADATANIVFGAVIDETKQEEMKITMIATGFAVENRKEVQPVQEVPEPKIEVEPEPPAIEAVAEKPEPVVEPYATVPIVETAIETSVTQPANSGSEKDSTYTDTPLFAPPVEEKSELVDAEVIPSIPVGYSPTDYEIPAFLRKRRAPRVTV